MSHYEKRTAVLLATVSLAEQFASLQWKKWSADEWVDVVDALSWPKKPVEEVLPSLARIQYLLDNGLNVTATFRNDHLVTVYAECYTYSFSLITPDPVKD